MLQIYRNINTIFNKNDSIEMMHIFFVNKYKKIISIFSSQNQLDIEL